jgi:hypothetical protein
MAFDTLSDRLKHVANGSLSFCKNQWGGNGLKKEESIDTRIGWKPTFFMRPNRLLTVGVEVSDVLYPTILKIAAHDVEHYNFPIAIYQACALDLYQKDHQFAKVNLLRDHGFGVITVDDNGMAVIQCRAEPIAQHISPERFDNDLKELNPALRVKFRTAYATYQTNIGQGLQESGQIIEALIVSITSQAISKSVVPPASATRSTAGKIDDLYPTNAFQNHRATLGAARDFVSTYRNISSHVPTTPLQASNKIRRCKAGFLDALRIAGALRRTIQGLGYQVKIV